MSSKLVLAIGNPGARYEGTRHNVGFDVADRVAGSVRGAFRKASPLHLELTIQDKGRVIKPLTYVNRSGRALEPLQSTTAEGMKNLLVVVDDIHLAPGTLRLKGKGSHGGHNGLRDLERVLGGQGYARLRIGVGSKADDENDLRDHVLGAFSKEDGESVARACERACQATLEFLAGQPLEELQRKYNGAGPTNGTATTRE